MARVLINGRVFSGVDPDALVDDGALAVDDDGRITFAGPISELPPELRDVEPVDLDGRFVMPGLVDCHVHLCHDGVVDVVAEAADDPALATIKALLNAQRALRAGVTAVRDLGARGHMAIGVGRAVAQGLVQGPRMVAAGRLITMTGGHGAFLGREVDGPDEMRRAAREEIKAGAGVIKTVATGGVLTPGISAQQSAFTEAELAAAVEAAHAAGIRCTAHAIGAAGIKTALRAGVDSVEHGCFLDQEAIDLMIERRAVLVATLSAPLGIINGADRGVPDYAVAKSLEIHEAHKDSFRRAVEAGVTIACGTDAGTPFNPHGSTPGEVALMVDNGMRPADALVAATRRGAELLGLAAECGTLEPGKAADVLVVEGNPLDDITALTRPWMVLAAGQPVSLA